MFREYFVAAVEWDSQRFSLLLFARNERNISRLRHLTKHYGRKIRAIDSTEFPISLSLSLSLSLRERVECSLPWNWNFVARITWNTRARVASRVNHRRRRIRQTRVRVVVSLSTYSSSRSLLLVPLPSSSDTPFLRILERVPTYHWLDLRARAFHRERSNSHCLAADVAWKWRLRGGRRRCPREIQQRDERSRTVSRSRTSLPSIRRERQIQLLLSSFPLFRIFLHKVTKREIIIIKHSRCPFVQRSINSENDKLVPLSFSL